MQREEFIQQLWLDYIHQHPDIGGLRLWPVDAPIEYLALLTLNHGEYAMDSLLPMLALLGYRRVHRHAMADRGLLVSLLAPPDNGAWLLLTELQLGTLSRHPRDTLKTLVSTHAAPTAQRVENLLCHGRPWPMPDWSTYQTLYLANPLAGWLAVMGPRLHHVGFDCAQLGSDIEILDQKMNQAGLNGHSNRHQGVFPVSPLLDFRFYPTRSRRMAFAQGDEHRIELGGLALVQKQVSANQERTSELLLPHHTRCEMS
ncbi:DUF1338 domain-containing protein [Halomonas korlensis]|uniref:2-oxoadipate dioxygenase/decarboxylase n=1 Tax=Halomonas korlensis TaxID=463301 RepID=A0A1I7EZY9_9GAMM|nr:DUF1338 domain-containing protein [Halomonas korlensis]SFU29454.1 hypothetical protein SAMN04487955_101133 [Halomonas korlensis]